MIHLARLVVGAVVFGLMMLLVYGVAVNPSILVLFMLIPGGLLFYFIGWIFLDILAERNGRKW